MAEAVFESYILYMLDMEETINKINAEIEENRKTVLMMKGAYEALSGFYGATVFPYWRTRYG
ncbi:Conjugal transfer protein TraK [Escherichia coli]|uniref:Conjugal transfer protein TraK n=1 Tax=Escherichia coli TaxID=562 RepID=A0A377BEQ1_ECOLX|nr:Conjugal transfer protein TraK [Escherichia coli]